MTQRLVTFAVAIAALSTVASTSWAGKVSVETTLPDPLIEQIQINGQGDVTSLKFAGGQVIQDPTVNLKDLAQIDILEFYNLSFDLLIAEEVKGGTVFLCIKFPDTSCRKAARADYLTLVLDQDGQITQVLDQNGSDVSEAPFNLSQQAIEDVSVLDIRTYRLIEYRDLSSGDTLQRIVQPAL